MTDEDHTTPGQPSVPEAQRPAEQEPLHWSERARMGLPPLSAAESKKARPATARPAPARSRRAARGSGRPRITRKTLLIMLASLVVVAAAVAAVLLWTGSDDEGSDTAADGPPVASQQPSATDPSGSSPATEGPGASGSGASEATGTDAGASTATSAYPESTVPAAPSTSAPPDSSTSASTVPTSTPSTLGPTGPLPDMMTFFDPVLGVAFSYPGSWMELSYDKVAGTFVMPTLGVAWADPAAGTVGADPTVYMMMAAYEEPGQTAVAARPALGEWEAMTLPQASGSMTALDAVAEFSTNGIPGAARTYRVLQQEQSSVMRVAFLSHDDSMYVLVLSAGEASWDTYLPIFDAVLQSFVIPM